MVRLIFNFSLGNDSCDFSLTGFDYNIKEVFTKKHEQLNFFMCVFINCCVSSS